MKVGAKVGDHIKEGDIVCFGQYSSITVRSHGTDFFFVKADELMSKYAQN